MPIYPSVITSFSYPASTDRLNNPSHSAVENSQSSTIGQIQAVIGLSGDAPGTIIGDIRSSSSDGGGHVQGVNKGGTNQTAYSKGDILVATSSSVLAKLSVSSTIGDVLIADSTQTTGMKWSNVVANKIAVNPGGVSFSGGVTSITQTYFATSILASTLGINNAVRFTAIFSVLGLQSGNITIITNYGNGELFNQQLTNIPPFNNLMSAYIEGNIVSNNSPSSQLTYVKFVGLNNKGAPSIINWWQYSNSSVNSSQDQNLIITGQTSAGGSGTSILTGSFIVEKIR